MAHNSNFVHIYTLLYYFGYCCILYGNAKRFNAQINGIFYNPTKKMVKIMVFFNMDYRSEVIATSFFRGRLINYHSPSF